MDLLQYNVSYLPREIGFNNTSSICWFNALLQALLSCTQLTEVMIEQSDKFTNNYMALAYIDLARKLRSGADISPNASSELLALFIKQCSRLNITPMEFTASCVDEALTLFVQAINNPYIDRLFCTKYVGSLTCEKCKKNTRAKFDVIITRTSTEKPFADAADLAAYMRAHATRCEQYVCDCGNKNINIPRAELLTMVSEIVAVSFDRRYLNSCNSIVPLTLAIRARGGKMIHYKLVSTVNHGGGHYIAYGFRAGESYFRCNDNYVEQCEYKTDNTVFIAFYSFVELKNE